MRRSVMVALTLTLILSGTLHAQLLTAPAVFSPAAPDENDEIRAVFHILGLCDNEPTTVVAGSVVRTTIVVTDCIPGPPPPVIPFDVFFGPIPAGTYTYEIFLDLGLGPELRSTQPLVIAAVAPTVPALSPLMLLLFGSALAGVALLVLPRT
jgi:hypothetical protein